ncbi:MAG: DUF3516 domain-containing protein [Polyangiaceae bacterium]
MSAPALRELGLLEKRLPEGVADADALLEAFLAYVEEAGLSLYPAQEEAVLELFAGKNVVLNTPTGSGKSLVALAACFAALARRERAFFTAPIKALVSEKFFDLCRLFGPHQVGMLTGDASINHDAPLICCTAEILSNMALREGADTDVQCVVMDEFHYYGDRDRGVAWQVPLLTLSSARFLLMSATLAEPERFVRILEDLTGLDTALVRTTERPVPLDWTYTEKPLTETIGELLNEAKVPVYIVHFSQRAASEQAQALMSLDFLSKEQKVELKQELKGFRFDSPFGRELGRFIPHGIGVHHAGMLPKYRRLVERLAQRGYLKLICGTDTLGVGINIPLRTVLFTQLCKYDGENTTILSVRDFQQIAGRAGRRGFDTQGSVVVQAPEHVIENLRIKAKAAANAKKNKKLHLKKPPERGFKNWEATTLTRLRESTPEALVSRFDVSHGMLLNVLSREDGSGCAAMKQLIRDSHEPTRNKRALGRTAIAMFRSLVEAKIIEVGPDGVRINSDLQEDFSLNRALALYAVEAISSLEPDEPGYALTVLSVLEAILEPPHQVLRRQVDTLKTRLMNELKAEGVEYEERLQRLEKVDYPKPEKEFIYGTFDAFAEHHPWVTGYRISPKSIARDMYEQGETFHGYIKTYGLQRAEGVLLRYLSDVYRVLEQTVPEQSRTEELSDLTEWLGAEIRQVDASLLDEWKALQDPSHVLREAETDEQPDITKDRRSFRVLVRNAAWRLLQALASQRYDRALRELDELAGEGNFALDEAAERWSADRLELAMQGYWSSYEEIRTDPSARSPKYLELQERGATWWLRQALVDPEDYLEWGLECEVDLDASRESGALVMRLLRLGVVS